MIVVIFEAEDKVQIDGYPDNVKVFNKEGFVKITDENNTMLALYNPARMIALRRVASPPTVQDTIGKNSDAKTLHPAGGAEDGKDSPDRGSAG